MTPRSARRAALVLSGAGGAFALTLVAILRAGRSRPLEQADVAVVFGAAASEEGASPELIARVDRAAELYERGYVPLIVCSGGRTRQVSEAEQMYELLIQRGVPADSLIPDDRGTTSRLALEAVARMGHGRWRTFLLVSSPYHLHRLIAEANRRGLHALPVPAAPLRLRWPPRSKADRRLLIYQLKIHVREVLAVWWYAFPLRPSTIEARKADKAARASTSLAALLAKPDDSGQVAASDSASALLSPAETEIFSGFGWRSPRHHPGVDFRATYGTPVRAAADGTVAYVGKLSLYGRTVAIRHGARLGTVYAHLSEIQVKDGEAVTAGQPIGAAGSSGNAFGPHLHFEVRADGTPVDPVGYIDGIPRAIEPEWWARASRVIWPLRRLLSITHLDAAYARTLRCLRSSRSRRRRAPGRPNGTL